MELKTYKIIDTVYAPLCRNISPDRTVEEVKVLIIVPGQSDMVESTDLFDKMFGHLQKRMAQEARIIPWQEEGISPFSDLAAHIPFRMLILCGVTAREVGLQSNLPLHTPVRLHNAWIMRTEAPGKLATASKDQKAEFWKAFKSTYEQLG